MGGLAVLALLGLYIFLAIKVFKVAKTTSAKVITLLLALLIPTADAIYGRIKLQQMCKAEGGLRVYRVVQDVEGFMGYAEEEMITKYGYQFVESCDSTRNCYKFSKKNDDIVKEYNVTPQSKFKVKLITLDNKGELYWRQLYSIDSISDSEILATETNIGFRGGWAERLIALFSDSGGGSVAVCNSAGLDPQKLVIAALKP